jgi:hypothetical protein
MRKFVLFAAVLAIAAPSLAFAGEAKKAEAPAIKATQMSDAEMDKVTAGDAPSVTGEGIFTGTPAGGPPSVLCVACNQPNSQLNTPGGGAGAGRLTAGK